MPDDLLGELAHFISFLKLKVGDGKAETVLLSESALGKDWSRPEEDEAWRDL
jgi:hypothetical protein